MRFAFTEDQLMLRETARELFRRECTPARLRQVWQTDATRVGEAWQRLAEIGVVTMLAAEVHGGLAMTELDLVLILEESGRAALPDPLVETAAVAVPLLGELPEDRPETSRWLAAIAAGNAIVATNLDGESYVPFGAEADLVLVRRGDELHALARDRVTATPHRSVDRARPLAALTWEPGEDTLLLAGSAARLAAERAFQRGALGAAAQLVGLGQHMLDMTVDYVKARHQFGKPIGSFQALKHKLADTLIGLEFARPVVYRAAHSLASGDAEAAIHVSMAKAYASDAATFAARAALQCHGAMGYSYEYDLHLWMKRTWALAAAWGDARWHRQRISSALLA